MLMRGHARSQSYHHGQQQQQGGVERVLRSISKNTPQEAARKCATPSVEKALKKKVPLNASNKNVPPSKQRSRQGSKKGAVAIASTSITSPDKLISQSFDRENGHFNHFSQLNTHAVAAPQAPKRVRNLSTTTSGTHGSHKTSTFQTLNNNYVSSHKKSAPGGAGNNSVNVSYSYTNAQFQGNQENSHIIGLEREELFQNISNLSIRDDDLFGNILNLSCSGSKKNASGKQSSSGGGGGGGENLNLQQPRLSSGKNIALAAIKEMSGIDDTTLSVQQQEQAAQQLERARDEFRAGEIEKCIATLQEVLQRSPFVGEAKYLLAVCLLSGGAYEASATQFCELIETQPGFKRNMYLLAAIAFKKLNNYAKAISILDKAAKKFPKYYDAYIYRGKLLVKEKQYARALEDFKCAIQINPQKGLGFIGLADCLRFSNQYREAVEIYTAAMQKEVVIARVARLKLAITHIEAKNYDAAQHELQGIIDNDPSNSEAYYFYGVLFYRRNKVNEAVLSFEQAIKYNNSRKAVTKALYEIAKIKIELRDYYSAFYTLCRADYLDVDKKALEKFRIFTDGVTFLMKRKYKEGIEHLSQLAKSENLSDFLRPLVYSYRAYGYICLAKHQKALNDLMSLENIQKLDRASQYNKFVCLGVTSASNNQFELAMNHFNKCQSLCSTRMEPSFYKGMTLVKFTNKLIDRGDLEKRRQYYQNALKNLERGAELNANNANLCYHLGLLKLALGNAADCLADLDKAIEKSDENVAKYFYTRGLAYSALKHYKQALQVKIDFGEFMFLIVYTEMTREYKHIYIYIYNNIKDFQITLSIQENYTEAYLNRAKCYHLTGDKNSAFQDLQKYTAMKPQDPDIHLWAGNLLFNIGATEDAVKAYSHYNNIAKNDNLLLLRAKCYMVLKELNSALADMQRIIEIQGERSPIAFDYESLNSLKTASMASSADTPQQMQEQLIKSNHIFDRMGKLPIEGVFFKQSDVIFYRGVNYFYLQNYEKALRCFNDSLKLKKEAKKKQQELKKNEIKRNSLQQLVDTEEDLSDSQLQARLKQQEDSEEENSELEDFDFENRTYNIFEYQYNIAVCFIMLGKFEEAHQNLSILQEILPDNECKINLHAFLDILEQEIEVQHNTAFVMDSAGDDEETQLVAVFPTHNRLCSIFAPIHMPFKIYKSLETKLSFCLPGVEAPSMVPEFDEQLILNLSPNVVENKPEAPWIHRTKDGIVFTDNVQNFDDLDLKTESKRSTARNENDISSGSESILHDQNVDGMADQFDLFGPMIDMPAGSVNYEFMQGMAYEDIVQQQQQQKHKQQYFEEQDKPVIDKSSLKKQLQLDSDIEAKLKKLLKK